MPTTRINALALSVFVFVTVPVLAVAPTSLFSMKKVGHQTSCIRFEEGDTYYTDDVEWCAEVKIDTAQAVKFMVNNSEGIKACLSLASYPVKKVYDAISLPGAQDSPDAWAKIDPEGLIKALEFSRSSGFADLMALYDEHFNPMDSALVVLAVSASKNNLDYVRHINKNGLDKNYNFQVYKDIKVINAIMDITSETTPVQCMKLVSKMKSTA